MENLGGVEGKWIQNNSCEYGASETGKSISYWRGLGRMEWF